MASSVIANAGNVIHVNACEGDATQLLQQAIDSAATYNGKPVTIMLMPGNYNISREKSSRHIYHISNTSSATENPDPTKHIGLWFRNIRNVTFDGNGAWIVTHGELSSLVVDNCVNVVLKNFTLTAADPSVPEFKVLDVQPSTMTVEVTSPSEFEIIDGEFNFVGDGWKFADGARETYYPEFAQVFYPATNITRRCESPLKDRKMARRLGERIVQFEYDKTPDVHAGEIYQLRHGIRNEACGFFNMSKDIRLENIEFNFMGNFGLVGQYSENLTYDNIRCRPALESKRTDAGFADFVQMSGCKGKIRIVNSYFEGAHDDPINIHGTHLKVVASDAPDMLTVRFMHDQSYGFTPFFKGDKVEIVDRHTLNCVMPATVKKVEKVDDYNFRLTLDKKIPELAGGSSSIEDWAVENVTWTPDVEIIDNYFSRIPTRGILITTRGKSLIQDNIFFRIPMPSILVSDDARGWYESGPVQDLVIRRNTFIECGSPVIAIWPEIDRFDKPVHKNILIEYNRFLMDSGKALSAKGAENVILKENTFILPPGNLDTISDLIETENTSGLDVRDNVILKEK